MPLIQSQPFELCLIESGEEDRLKRGCRRNLRLSGCLPQVYVSGSIERPLEPGDSNPLKVGEGQGQCFRSCLIYAVYSVPLKAATA